jgi:hypothetical protein
VSRNNSQQEIIGILTTKAALKQLIYDHTAEAFITLKEAMKELVGDLAESMEEADPRIIPEFKDYGKFAAQMRISGDTLVCSMHTNIFEFNREHKIWEVPYVKDEPLNSYCGIINIYNFLTDSFKYNRLQDLGYLIARIFINKDNHFFVEGKRQAAFQYKNFGKLTVSRKSLKEIIERAILYSMQFDLLVPPYDNVKIISVEQMSAKILSSLQQTGKRLGFQFNSDDVLEE